MRTTDEILDILEEMFPEAQCELNHNSLYQLIIAVILSAQATDVSVNKVTPALFQRYPDVHSLAMGDIKDIEDTIKNIGLYRNKARMIKEMAQLCVESYGGNIPSRRKDLQSLPGVGRKTANVVMSVWFHVPAIAVDTHVERISKRLYLAKPDDSVLKVEEKLRRKINRSRWNRAHHLFIFFGRYFCKAKVPMCDVCPLKDQCRYYKEKRA
ncbi:MAG: endonuclease III [Firmicutes bacterium HGW-Firmicutes-19]|jgi:endonuclease III|nr:MAG: endonuclease III [Firmicutes bacterium HGW-Firmicutes-19]